MKLRTLITLLAIGLLAALGAMVLALKGEVGSLDRATLEQWGEIPVMITAPTSMSLWIDDTPLDRAPDVETAIVQLSEGEHTLRAEQPPTAKDFTFQVFEGAPPVIQVAVSGSDITFDAK